MSRASRATYYLTPLLVCAAVYWRAPFIWFRIDDFAWLGLPQMARTSGWGYALFHPEAQGTVRVLSERLFFLALSGAFGLHAWPFRVASLGTWFADLILIQLIGARLTRSRAAGLWAAVLWTTSATLMLPLAWASAYNEVLCAFFMLAAFYAHLRWIESDESRWRWTEWIAYLLGFGALEVIVVYPVLVLLYAALNVEGNTEAHERRPATWRNGVWMLLPAAAFGLAHLFLMPALASPVYRLYFDRRLISDFFAYVLWTVGPSRMEVVNAGWAHAGVVVSKFTAFVLAAFVCWKAVKREFSAVFMTGWFVVVLAPVWPLANHMSDYYLTVPGIGLAWLAGWGLVTAWRTGLPARALAVGLMALYAAGSIAEIDRIGAWQMDVTARMRVLIRALRDTASEHPGTALVLTGVPPDLFLAGFHDNPFRLLGIAETWLAPGQDQILDSAQAVDRERYRTSIDKLAPRLARQDVRVLEVLGATVRDVTAPYSAAARALFQETHHNFVDVGDPIYAASLRQGKPGWYDIENHARWIGRGAALDIWRNTDGPTRLYVTGYAPAGALASGPVTMRFLAGGKVLGSATIANPDQPFAADFAVPPGPASSAVHVAMECDRTFRAPHDVRDLCMVLKTFAIR